MISKKEKINNILAELPVSYPEIKIQHPITTLNLNSIRDIEIILGSLVVGGFLLVCCNLAMILFFYWLKKIKSCYIHFMLEKKNRKNSQHTCFRANWRPFLKWILRVENFMLKSHYSSFLLTLTLNFCFLWWVCLLEIRKSKILMKDRLSTWHTLIKHHICQTRVTYYSVTSNTLPQ